MRRIYILLAVALMALLMVAWSAALMAQPQGSGGHVEVELGPGSEDDLTLSGGHGGKNCSDTDIFTCEAGGTGGHLQGEFGTGEIFIGGIGFGGSSVSGLHGEGGGCFIDPTTGERQCGMIGGP
jgi:opacity protein-like surface antigen